LLVPGRAGSVPVPVPGRVGRVPVGVPGSAGTPGRVGTVPVPGSAGTPGRVGTVPVPGSAGRPPVPGSAGRLPVPGSVGRVPTGIGLVPVFGVGRGAESATGRLGARAPPRRPCGRAFTPIPIPLRVMASARRADCIFADIVMRSFGLWLMLGLKLRNIKGQTIE